METSKRTGSQFYLPTLDGWRGVAILMVILHHDGLHRLGFISTSIFYQYGALGVDLFFAISGILICSRLLDEERRFGSFSLKSFYIRRAFRILPAALAYLCIVGGLGLAGLIPLHLHEWTAALLFWRNYLPAKNGGGPDSMWYTGHFWSLAVEEHFYLLLPAILLFTKRRMTTLISFALLVIAWRGYVDLHWSIDRFRTDQRLDALLIPAVLAIALATWGKQALKPYMRLSIICPLALAFAFCVRHSLFAMSVLEPFVFASVVMATVLSPETWLGRILENRALRYVGRLSYGLYLWQQLFFVQHYENGVRPLGWLQAFPANWICLLIIVLASYYLLERPLLKVGHRLASRQAKIVVTESSRIPDLVS